MEALSGKNIVVGITGGIASYKSCELIRSLVKKGAQVHCAITKNASRFITSLTLQTLSGNKVASDPFDLAYESEIGHIKTADDADAVVIAPASASFIGKIAAGIADSMPAAVILATRAPVVICPAMNSNMYSNSIVRENMEKLRRHGFIIVEPDDGRLACGWTGTGRLPETEIIVLEVAKAVTRQDFAGKNILVSAGATREHIDPVRFISNPSTGKMGCSAACAARLRGANVTLVSGYSAVPYPYGVKVVTATDSASMYEEMHRFFPSTDIVIKAAAVSDYSSNSQSDQKIKKSEKKIHICLEKTRDILAALGKNKGEKFLVGFAAETENIILNARKKLEEKNLDLVVANDITDPDSGFAKDTNAAWLIDSEKTEQLPLMSKFELANRILDRIKQVSGEKSRHQ